MEKPPILPFCGIVGDFLYLSLIVTHRTKEMRSFGFICNLLIVLNKFCGSKLSSYLCIIKQWYVRDAECLRLIVPR
jgi:hypothetical protein